MRIPLAHVSHDSLQLCGGLWLIDVSFCCKRRLHHDVSLPPRRRLLCGVSCVWRQQVRRFCSVTRRHGEDTCTVIGGELQLEVRGVSSVRRMRWSAALHNSSLFGSGSLRRCFIGVLNWTTGTLIIIKVQPAHSTQAEHHEPHWIFIASTVQTDFAQKMLTCEFHIS